MFLIHDIITEGENAHSCTGCVENTCEMMMQISVVFKEDT
jgi:hypothetical protein